MSDDDDQLASLLDASDDRLAAVILAATGVPATRADLRRWRSALRRVLHRARHVRECEPEPVATVPIYRDEARELVIDLLTSPEMVLLLAAAIAAVCVVDIAVSLRFAARSRHTLLSAAAGLDPDDLDCAHAYAAALASPGGVTSADYWLAVRVAAPVRAALRAATTEHLAWWADRLASARASSRRSDGVLRALSADGVAVLTAYPDLDLGAVVPGPSLGIWAPADDDLGAAPAPSPVI